MKEQQLKRPLLQHQRSEPNRNKSFLSLFKYADKIDRVLMFVGTLAAITAGIASPLFMIFFSTISQIFIPGNEQFAQSQGRDLFFKLMTVGIFTWISHALAIWSWNKSGARQTLRLKQLYYRTLLCQSVSWYDCHNSGKLTTQISQNTIAIETAIGQKMAFTITALVTSLFGFIFAFVKCWQMSLYLCLFLPFMLIGGFLMIKATTLKTTTSKISYEDASSIAQNAFSSIKTVKSLIGQRYQKAKFQKILRESQQKVSKHILYAALASGFFNLIAMGLYSFGFFIGKVMIIDNPQKYEPYEIISTFFCFMVAGQSIGQISPIFKNIADAKVAANKIYQLLQSQDESAQIAKQGIVDRISQIKLRQISFSYDKTKQQHMKQGQKIEKDTNILNNLSLTFKKGTFTAIVGHSGSGKSTIAQIILRYYDPQAGSMTINDEPAQQINLYQFRKKIGYVSQQPVLFSMSIKDNIKLANPQMSDAELIQVLKKANAWEFVEKLQKGVDTFVGNAGTQLSGGQKQRIAIARALAKKPEVMILDEATSALDQVSQTQIQKTVRNLSQTNIILIVIAHRLSTIKRADRIIVLEKGQIIQQGTHKQLYQQQKQYYNLIKNQIDNESDQRIAPTMAPIGSIEDKGKKQELHLEKQIVPAVQKQKMNRLQIYGKLLKISKKLKIYFIFGSIFALINGLIYPFFNLSFSNVMGLMANATQNDHQINLYCIGFLVVAIVTAISNFTHFYFFSLFGERLVLMLRVKLFYKILKFPCSYFDKQQNNPGAISMKISKDSFQLHNVLTGIMSVLCLNFSTILTSLTFSFIFSWKLSLIVLLFTPILAAKGSIQISILKRISNQTQDIQKFLGALISDTISNIRTVKSFGGYDQFMNLFSQKAIQIQKISSAKTLKIGFLQGFSRSTAIIIYAIVFWVAAALFAHNQFEQPKDALITIFCLVFAATTVGQNSQLMPDLTKAELSASNILETLQSKDQFDESRQKQDKNLRKYKIKGSIEFRNVKFKYPSRSNQILENFSLKIKQKQKVVIVGPSGSGKTTILHILMRLYPIQQGEIFVDNYPLQKLNLRQFRRQLGVLLQQPMIFAGSIQENILYQFEGVNRYESKFNAYCNIACVDKIANNFQQGYGKKVGEKGTQVSGGEKQRISLARCLIRKPKLLLMDQPTSALDVQTESTIFENMRNVIKNKTLLFTTHRISTIKLAQRIIVMKNGCLVQQGSYEQLMAKKQQFYKLSLGLSSQLEEHNTNKI